jgi:hypothetical protein
MSQRLDRAWTVITSIDNLEHDRWVDFFARRDRSFGFEEFRSDVEDRGVWTPVQHYAFVEYTSAGEALAAAERNVPWLSAVMAGKAHLRELLVRPVPRT